MCLTHPTIVKRKEPPSRPLDLRSFQPTHGTRLSFTRFHPIQVPFLHIRPLLHGGPASTGRRLAFYEFKLWKGILILFPLLVPDQIFSQTTNCEPSPSQATLRLTATPILSRPSPPIRPSSTHSSTHSKPHSQRQPIQKRPSIQGTQSQEPSASASLFPLNNLALPTRPVCSWSTIRIPQPSPSPTIRTSDVHVQSLSFN